MKRARVSEFPKIRVAVNPRTLEALRVEAEDRALPVSAVIREALDRAYRPAAPKSGPDELHTFGRELV
jgi:hypothetical protein